MLCAEVQSKTPRKGRQEHRLWTESDLDQFNSAHALDVYGLDGLAHTDKHFNRSQPAAEPRCLLIQADNGCCGSLHSTSIPKALDTLSHERCILRAVGPPPCKHNQANAARYAKRSLFCLSSKMSPVAAVRRCTTQALAPPIMPQSCWLHSEHIPTVTTWNLAFLKAAYQLDSHAAKAFVSGVASACIENSRISENLRRLAQKCLCRASPDLGRRRTIPEQMVARHSSGKLEPALHAFWPREGGADSTQYIRAHTLPGRGHHGPPLPQPAAPRKEPDPNPLR